MTPHTAKRKRRRAKQRLKCGSGSVRSHAKIGGRTGMIQSKKTPGKSVHYSHHWPNPVVHIASLGGPLWT